MPPSPHHEVPETALYMNLIEANLQPTLVSSEGEGGAVGRCGREGHDKWGAMGHYPRFLHVSRGSTMAEIPRRIGPVGP